MSQESRWPPKVNLFQVVVAIIVVSAIFIGYAIATLPPAPPPPSEVASRGDRVEVDYIGFFANGRVFDTSLKEVAEDNASYPKAVSFRLRPTYSPLQFTIAAQEVIRGFEEGVLGMRIGETLTLEITPEMGYGDPDPTLLEVRPLIDELPQVETLRGSDFRSRFRVHAQPGLTVREPVWGWNVTVVSMSTDFVTIFHVPIQGTFVKPYSWLVRVLKVDSSANQGQGVIVLEHQLFPEDVGVKGGEDSRGAFSIAAVDREVGTFTVDYNLEVTGKTLFFEVTLLRIIRA